MGEEVRITDYGVAGAGDEFDERVSEWEAGLPEVHDLTPLSQSLISSELLSAFNITPAPYRNMIDVNRASQNTLSDLRGEVEQQSLTRFNSLKSCNYDKGDEMVTEGDETADLTSGGSEFLKIRRLGSGGDGDGDVDGGVIEEADIGDASTRASKRPRLVWTPQLHKRFIEVVAHLGVKNAVPKTIMQLMNVEGLTRENVASHLQKYRLYLKRMQGASPRGPPPSDHLFASTPAPQNRHESAAGGGGGGGNEYRHAPAAVPMHYHQQMVPMPYPSQQMVPNSATDIGGGAGGGYHHGFESNSYQYNMTMQQRDWFQHHRTSNDK